MRDREQNLVSGNLKITTPEGPIQLAFSLNIERGADIAGKYLQRLFAAPTLDLTQEASKPAVLQGKVRKQHAPANLAYFEKRKEWDPVFALLQPDEIEPIMTIKVVNQLRRAQIKSVESLAALTDEEIADKTNFRNTGPKTTDYILHLRQLAQRKLEETRTLPQEQ